MNACTILSNEQNRYFFRKELRVYCKVDFMHYIIISFKYCLWKQLFLIIAVNQTFAVPQFFVIGRFDLTYTSNKYMFYALQLYFFDTWKIISQTDKTNLCNCLNSNSSTNRRWHDIIPTYYIESKTLHALTIPPPTPFIKIKKLKLKNRKKHLTFKWWRILQTTLSRA